MSDMNIRERRWRRPTRTLLGSGAWWAAKHERQRKQIAAGVDGLWFRDGITRNWKVGSGY